MARGRENARLARAVDAAADLRQTVEIAGALVWDRDGRMTILRVLHDFGSRRFRLSIERGDDARSARNQSPAGVARHIIAEMGIAP
jgi:hypothetical protein